MIRNIALFLALAALAGCGADGEPKPPTAKTGVSLTGQVKVGVSGSG